MSAKLFETIAGNDVLVAPYQGSPGGLTALRAGAVDIAFEIVSPVVPQATSGVIGALSASPAGPAGNAVAGQHSG